MYRYTMVRTRIAASQLVMSRGKRFESARRLSRFGLDELIIRNSGRFDRTKVGILIPFAFSSAGVDRLMSRTFALYRCERKSRNESVPISPETRKLSRSPLGVGRARVMETTSL